MRRWAASHFTACHFTPCHFTACHLTACHLTALQQTIAEEAIEFANRMDLAGDGFNGVLDTMKANDAVLERHVAGAGITVARLAHTADIDHKFFLTTNLISRLHIIRTFELARLGKDTWDVRMPLKTALRDNSKIS